MMDTIKYNRQLYLYIRKIKIWVGYMCVPHDDLGPCSTLQVITTRSVIQLNYYFHLKLT